MRVTEGDKYAREPATSQLLCPPPFEGVRVTSIFLHMKLSAYEASQGGIAGDGWRLDAQPRPAGSAAGDRAAAPPAPAAPLSSPKPGTRVRLGHPRHPDGSLAAVGGWASRPLPRPARSAPSTRVPWASGAVDTRVSVGRGALGPLALLCTQQLECHSRSAGPVLAHAMSLRHNHVPVRGRHKALTPEVHGVVCGA